MAKGAGQRAQENAAGPDLPRPGLIGCFGILHRGDELEHFTGGEPARDLLDCEHPQAQFTIEHEHRRHRDAAFFPGVEHAAARDYFPAAVGQNRVGQGQVALDCGATLRGSTDTDTNSAPAAPKEG